MAIVHTILSGGVGSRLWPVSRKSMPKQYIPMFGEKSLFELTVRRSKGIADRTLIVGNKDNYLLSQADLLRAGVSNYVEIIESAPRNTAAAIAFAALAVDSDDILLVTPSDHIISDQIAYKHAVSQAINLAGEGYLVTFGIAPSKPETGYGYIEYSGDQVYSFREKPDLATAISFIKQGTFLWNSGMFCFKAGAFLAELELHEPLISQTALLAWNKIDNGFLPKEETMQIPSKSIDYAVMERSAKIKVVTASFNWSDLGSFEAIWDHWEEQGESHRFKQNNCIVGSTKHVEFLGVSNLIYIETEDAILILDKQSSQDVKTIFERLENDHPNLVV